VGMARQRPDDGIDTIMGEFVAMAGRSHPCSPDLTWMLSLTVYEAL